MPPASGWCAPERTFISVLLPAPFSPTSATTSPALTRRSTPPSASVAPNRLTTPSMRRRSVPPPMLSRTSCIISLLGEIEELARVGVLQVVGPDEPHPGVDQRFDLFATDLLH